MEKKNKKRLIIGLTLSAVAVSSVILYKKCPTVKQNTDKVFDSVKTLFIKNKNTVNNNTEKTVSENYSDYNKFNKFNKKRRYE